MMAYAIWGASKNRLSPSFGLTTWCQLHSCEATLDHIINECLNGDLAGLDILPYITKGKELAFCEWDSVLQVKGVVDFTNLALRVAQAK